MKLYQRMIAGVARMAGFIVSGTHPSDPALRKMWGLGRTTSSGVTVDHDRVLALPAVIRATNIISDGVADVPFYVFEQNDKTLTWDKDHPSWGVVTSKPHKDITSGVFRKTMTSWAVLYGNAVAYISRPNWPDKDDRMQLIPLLPDRTYPVRITRRMAERHADLADQVGALYFKTKINGKEISYRASILQLDGTDTNIDADINDPLGMFADLSNGDPGFCFKQDGEYWAIQGPCGS